MRSYDLEANQVVNVGLSLSFLHVSYGKSSSLKRRKKGEHGKFSFAMLLINKYILISFLAKSKVYTTRNDICIRSCVETRRIGLIHYSFSK